MNDIKELKQNKVISIPETLTVKHLSELLNLPASQVITELIKNGIIATINEEIDFETASIIAEDLGFKTERDLSIQADENITLEKLLDICQKEKESKKNLQTRPPVVTILGHVDHGKTTLLNTIRKSHITNKEAGGITQHISAYQVKKRGQLITFIDTPGHEAFSAMRERGVSLADIAILVVAADDGVRPQTKEVIEYLKEKKIPTIVAINKIDKPEANPTKVKQELAENEIVIEEWGGDIIANEISAKNNLGIDKLLESILLVTEILELKADFQRPGLAVVLESHLDKHKGPIATVLVKTGFLQTGQDIIAGNAFGRIKRLEDFTGKKINKALPSSPVTLMGLNKVPQVNDVLYVTDTQTLSHKKNNLLKNRLGFDKKILNKEKIYQKIDENKLKKLNLIIKTDVQGSLEAIHQILDTIKSKEVAIEYIFEGIGNITESDVKIAESSQAEIIGFNVHTTTVAKRMAENSNINIETYTIIYELIDAIKNKLSGLLPPEIIRTDLGKLKVLAIFKRGKKDMIVGGLVTQGKIEKNCLVDIVREKENIGQGTLTNLQHNKNNVTLVKQGNECGLTIETKTKIEIGDILVFYQEEEKRRKI